jgi:hypothetical protein
MCVCVLLCGFVVLIALLRCGTCFVLVVVRRKAEGVQGIPGL